jgi:hypothetical protein
MGDIIGLGISHWPRLAKVDSELTIRLKLSLRDPHIPDDAKRVSSWPEAMQREWGDDQGLTAAPKHRAEMLEGIRKVRATLDTFRPDAVIVWGDDQYENFREDIIPPFCVLAYDQAIETTPYAESRMEGSAAANIWNRPHDETYTVNFAPEVAKTLVRGLLDESFDIAYAYRPLHFPTLSHAFLNAVLYLDYDLVGFPYPIVPFTVNCYGKYVISHRGTQLSKVKEDRFLDPPSPTPKRCFDVGAATARVLRASPSRIALLASSSWSHAFLCTKHFQLRPDNAADHRLYTALLEGDFAAWRDTPLADIVDAGQQEMLNWFCLMGAMSELNGKLTWSQFVETYVFNSDKVAAIYAPVLA